MKCINLDSWGYISMEREMAEGTFPSFTAWGFPPCCEGLKLWPLLCLSELLLVQTFFCSISASLQVLPTTVAVLPQMLYFAVTVPSEFCFILDLSLLPTTWTFYPLLPVLLPWSIQFLNLTLFRQGYVLLEGHICWIFLKSSGFRWP